VQLHQAFIPLLLGVLTGAAVLAAPTPTVITSDHPDSVQRGITEAYRTGQKRIVIPAGTYYIKPPSAGSHLQFHGMSDFEIDARDVHFVFTDQTRGGIEFLNCRSVRLRGASIRFETPPFTQAVVEGIAPDGAWYDVRVEKGYPTNFDDARYFPAQPIGYLFDSKTRWWKPGTYDLYGQAIKRLGTDRFRVFWNVPAGPRLHPVAVGDLMGFRGSGPHNVTIVTSTRVSLIGVTIYNAGSFAVWESGGDGDNHYSITVKRGPRPPEAVTDPLFSSTADAFHSTDVRKGPVLEQCYFEAMADDGIAIHGTYSLVLRAEGNKFVINHGNFRPGDPLRLFDPGCSSKPITALSRGTLSREVRWAASLSRPNSGGTKATTAAMLRFAITPSGRLRMHPGSSARCLLRPLVKSRSMAAGTSISCWTAIASKT
jgi:hypothetical protein